jgi:hypothetical protein
MNKRFAQFALPVLAFAFTSVAQANTPIVVEFEPGSDFFATSPWEMYRVDSTSPRFANSGFTSLGSQWVATNYREHPLVTFSASSGTPFDLNSLLLAGAWGSQTLTIVGYTNGVATYTTTVEISTTAKQFDFTGFMGIDKFTVATGNDFVRDPSASRNGLNWAMGSVNVTVVPEPQTYAMLLAGLGIVGAIARRRQRN